MPKPTRRPRQLDLKLPRWGGARRGAGRKPKRERAGVAHCRRPALAARHPVHVTLRLERGLPSLRSPRCFAGVRASLARARERLETRLVHYSVQGNHIHLLVEAASAQALSRATKGLSVRVARAINCVLGRRGRVFADRYHAHVLRTPRETRHAIAYVLNNYRHHARPGAYPGRWLDPFASGMHFDGWREPPPDLPAALAAVPPAIVVAQSWLLAVAWRRHGLIGLDEVPGG